MIRQSYRQLKVGNFFETQCRSQPRPHCVRRGPSSLREKDTATPLF